ncbi:GNAT family N-acetyltransferase [uncultured Cellulomonas sp.]|uniref:GNAT family N-acetyltransferase n=1 Tax=uncultured Cellulomonas sp. TaxID=189682 RepID=UPI002621AA3D|nr:GNAT family N-acetyltransferase [uncultured Cellulomonas sp.]
MSLFREQADVSVRPAVADDADAVADVQLGAWRVTHADTVGADVLTGLDRDAVQAQWAAAITRPPGPGYRVLVACEGATVVGLAAVAPLPASPQAPLDAPGGELVALEVSPSSRRSGHGSRLLTAVVDGLRQDGAGYLTAWVLDGDSARAQFLRSAGLGPDGTVRELATGPVADPGAPDGSPAVERTVAEHRWTAAI